MILPTTTPSPGQYPLSGAMNRYRHEDSRRETVDAVGVTEGRSRENDTATRAAKQAGRIECQTCKERKYQDGSNDPGVSFKSPTHISPDNAAQAVMSHEQEHVRNESAKALQENRTIVSQTVTLKTGVCPECGRTYVAGGTTRTVTKANETTPDFFTDQYRTGVQKPAAQLFSAVA